MTPKYTATVTVAAAKPAPINRYNYWNLNAGPDRVEATARAWREFAKAARRHARYIDGPAQDLYDGKWRGEAADTFNNHRLKLTRDMQETAAAADQTVAALEAAATNLTTAQKNLDSIWGTVRAYADPKSDKAADVVTFQLKDDSEREIIDKAVKAARDVHVTLDEQLRTNASSVAKARSHFEIVTKTWQNYTSSSEPFTMPPPVKGVRTLIDYEDDQYLINTGLSSDKVEVKVDPTDPDRRIITVNGVDYIVPPGMQITIRGSAGNDTFEVQDGVGENLTILGSSGNDKFDTEGSSGKNRFNSETGHDRILAGAGDDQGMTGNGNDWISAGEGDDKFSAGDGEDVVRGDAGNDTLNGNDGKDRMYTGTGGDDQVFGDNDLDRVTEPKHGTQQM